MTVLFEPSVGLLPLEQMRQVVSYNPWHFWGMANASKVPLSSECNQVVTEYAWQASQAAGREEVRQALMFSERRMRELLGYSLAPHFVQEEIKLSGQQGAWGADGRWSTVKVREGLVQQVGVESLTLLGTPAVTLTDVDTDGLDDTFTTAAVATTETDPARIAVYFKAADRYDGSGLGDRWRIAPVTVSIAAGSVTVKGPAWLLVRPAQYQGVSASNGLDPLTAGIYADHLDVCVRKCDSAGITQDTAQAVLVWETQPWPWYCCYAPSPSSSDPAAEGYALARVALHDAKRGVLGIGQSVWSTTSSTWLANDCNNCRPPDRVIVRYLAGASWEAAATQSMQQQWRQAVARLALAEMMRRISSCDTSNREIYYWQMDMARAGGTLSEQFKVSDRDLDNPLGTRAGQVYAWRLVRYLYQLEGVTA